MSGSGAACAIAFASGVIATAVKPGVGAEDTVGVGTGTLTTMRSINGCCCSGSATNVGD